MTVKELIEILKDEDPDRVVILQKDSEGNGHSPLSNCWTGIYNAEATCYGEVGLEELTEELKKQGYSDEDVIEGKKAVILCPVN